MSHNTTACERKQACTGDVGACLQQRTQRSERHWGSDISKRFHRHHHRVVRGVRAGGRQDAAPQQLAGLTLQLCTCCGAGVLQLQDV